MASTVNSDSKVNSDSRLILLDCNNKVNIEEARMTDYLYLESLKIRLWNQTRCNNKSGEVTPRDGNSGNLVFLIVTDQELL